MGEKNIVLPAIVLSILGCVGNMCWPQQARVGPAGPPQEPYVEVISVALRPTAVHRRLKPNETSVTVKVGIHGRVPRGATAQVELGTYRSDPAGGVVVEYLPTTLVKPLKGNPTIFKFKIRATPQTLQGTLTVAASLGEVTQGVNRIDPPPPEQFLADLKTLDP